MTRSNITSGHTSLEISINILSEKLLVMVLLHVTF